MTFKRILTGAVFLLFLILSSCAFYGGYEHEHPYQHEYYSHPYNHGNYYYDHDHHDNHGDYDHYQNHDGNRN